MKTLYLLRHAKSSWDDPELNDHQRPLNQRGERDAPRMGNWIATHMAPPQLVLCSDAVRTRQTIAPVLKAWQLQENKVLQLEPRLYHADTDVLWELVQDCRDEIDSLLLVGHNPGLTEFANSLCKAFHTENIPTCGFFACTFHIKKWQEAEASEAAFEAYQYPKNL